MGDLTLAIRHCKRSRSTKLDLNGWGLSSLPQDIYQLTDLEFLNLSNNKLLSIDPKISNLTKLNFLDISNNQIITLPQSLTQLTGLKVLNVSGNPLGSQFEALLKKENQSDPNLQPVLKGCFNSGGLGSPIGLGSPGTKMESTLTGFSTTLTGFSTSQPLSLDKHFGGTQTKFNWLSDQSTQEESKSFASDKKDDLLLKKQLSETESLLAREQQKNIELQKELEKLKSSQLDMGRTGFQMKTNRNEFGLPDEIAQQLEVNFNELEIGEGISQGGFSIVHKGYFRGTQVAIKKIFNPNITSELLAEISNEVDMLNRLRHPNIVLLMGICSKPSNLCIVTEYLPNGSLFNLLHMSNTELKPEMRLAIAREIALSINFLHLSNIVHRDIKSHNVLLDEKLRVKLCDFGLARHMDALNKGTMQFSGTPTYMAPEIFQKRAYDEKIDVFAFGTLLWELFARKVPFEGLEPADVMQKVLREDQLSMIGIPKKIAQIVTECRFTDPRKRPRFNHILDTLNNIQSL